MRYWVGRPLKKRHTICEEVPERKVDASPADAVDRTEKRETRLTGHGRRRCVAPGGRCERALINVEVQTQESRRPSDSSEEGDRIREPDEAERCCAVRRIDGV